MAVLQENIPALWAERTLSLHPQQSLPVSTEELQKEVAMATSAHQPLELSVAMECPRIFCAAAVGTCPPPSWAPVVGGWMEEWTPKVDG